MKTTDNALQSERLSYEAPHMELLQPLVQLNILETFSIEGDFEELEDGGEL